MAQKERYEEFEAVIRRLYSDEGPDFIQSMEVEIREQIRLEAAKRSNITLGHALIELFNKTYIKRTAIAIVILQVACFSGSGVVQNYQSILYAQLGFGGEEVLLISACYGLMGVIGQVINVLIVSDKWPRIRTMCKYIFFPMHITLLCG